jgi:hypothetical protein
LEIILSEGYDIVGDVHGRVATLRALVQRLGYRHDDGHWGHPENRQLVSVGDLLDDGQNPLDCLELIEEMAEDGCAAAVMGNHELNALHYMADPPLRRRSPDNTKQFASTLAQIENDRPRWERARRFIERIPTRLELDGGRLRVIHACWDEECIDELPLFINTPEKLYRTSTTPPENRDWADNRDPDREAGLKESADPLFVAIEQCIKGAEVPSEPRPDHRGKMRYKERVAWWDTYDGKPRILFGHYKFPWSDGRSGTTPAEPGWTGPGGHAACLDYGAHAGRMLVALRWPEDEFVTIDCMPMDRER